MREALGNVGECSGENHAQDFHRRERGAREGPSNGCKTCGHQPVSGWAEWAEGTHVTASRCHLPAASLFPKQDRLTPRAGTGLAQSLLARGTPGTGRFPTNTTAPAKAGRGVSPRAWNTSRGLCSCLQWGFLPQRLKAQLSPPSLLLENAWSSLPPPEWEGKVIRAPEEGLCGVYKKVLHCRLFFFPLLFLGELSWMQIKCQ